MTDHEHTGAITADEYPSRHINCPIKCSSRDEWSLNMHNFTFERKLLFAYKNKAKVIMKCFKEPASYVLSVIPFVKQQHSDLCPLSFKLSFCFKRHMEQNQGKNADGIKWKLIWICFSFLQYELQKPYILMHWILRTEN